MGTQELYGLVALLLATAMLALIGPAQAMEDMAPGLEDSAIQNETFLRLPVVQSPPKITRGPQDRRVIEGEAVSFFCSASGTPPPEFDWERNGRKINPRRSRYEIKSKAYITSLRVNPVKMDVDNTTFTCLAHNSLGEARIGARLSIYPKNKNANPDPQAPLAPDGVPDGFPRITVQPKLRSVEKDHSAQLECEARGNPKPTISWLKDKLPVDESDSRIKITEAGYLQIHNTQESDEATYECVAENEYGVTYSYGAMIYVRVRRIAPKFTRVPESKLVSPMADINLTCEAVGSPMPYVRWRQGGHYYTPDDEKPPIGQNVLTLLAVKESKNYTCEASSDLGNIEHVVQISINAPGTPPRNLTARADSATSLTLKWAPPEKPNGEIKGYQVLYSDAPNEVIFFWRNISVGNVLTTRLTGLRPNVTYGIAILAFSSVGEGPTSDAIKART